MSKNINKAVNSFQEGLNMDVSDFLMKNTQMRWSENIRIVDYKGSSFLVTNLEGNETSFQISPTFIPVAIQEFNQVLYIISWSQSLGKIELGSYPSPGVDIFQYRPLSNISDNAEVIAGVSNPFRINVSLYGLPNTKPIISKLEIQPDYDRSVNLLFTFQGYKPRIVNSKFRAESDPSGIALSAVPERAGAANSNTYTFGSLDKETALIIYSNKILGIDWGGISSGGKLKCGNYTYIFHYMTEDFVQTSVIGQSSVCQVAFGNTNNTRRGGDETQETDLRTILNLTNIDTDFKYLKVYAHYNSGQEDVAAQYLEFTLPVTITGTSMAFSHTGFEELAEVSEDVVNVDYASIEGADASTQVGGFYFLGGVKQRSYDYTNFQAAASTVTPSIQRRAIAGSTLFGYSDPENVYKYMGHFGGESYPYGIVFVMPGGETSPVFPTKGTKFTAADVSGIITNVPTDQARGIVTFPSSAYWPIYEAGSVYASYLRFDLTGIPQTIKDNSLGFFIVRAERRPNMVSQGIMVPTLRVPPLSFYASPGNIDTYYRVNINETVAGKYGFVPCVDNLMEAWTKDEVGTGADPEFVLDDNFNISKGYMPITITDLKQLYVTNVPDVYSTLHWAYIPGDSLLNQPRSITRLNSLTNQKLYQLAKLQMRVKGQLQNVANTEISPPPAVGMHYDTESLTIYKNSAVNKTINRISFVPPETFATGGDFLSKADFGIIYDDSGPSYWRYDVQQHFNSYFGIEMGELPVDGSKGVANPIAGNARRSADTIFNKHTMGVQYANNNTLVPAAFLVNIYGQSGQVSGETLYPSTEDLVYRQVSKRYAWGDVGSSIDVYGGDCYIQKISRKLYQSGYRLPANGAEKEALNSRGAKANIDMGLMVSWYQEAVYNLSLRQEKIFDSSESAPRSFSPVKGSGDFLKYRSYRYPETLAHSPGYSVLTRPKIHIPIPTTAVVLEDYFFSRIAHSDRHIPNAFKNGYRSFLPTNSRDYDSSLGKIIGMNNHRGRLFVIFEHGLGITDIEQRVFTGGDAAGGVFVKPSDVLPPTLTFISREIGCQDHLSIVQTPGAVYGVDRLKSKIWKFSDKLEVISENSVSSYILDNILNPRSGYDLQNSEVIFCTDNWTLCFREGMEKFTSFYSFNSAQYFARRNQDFYSFIGNQSWKHNHPNFMIYNQQRNSVIEFVINEGIGLAKVIDYLNLISNEVPPTTVEWYTYNQSVDIGPTIQTGAVSQYAKVENVLDVVEDESPILYRDKKFSLKVPYRSEYNIGSVEDEWSVEGRIRDKYIICRLTYNTSLPLELASVISSYRYSAS